MALPVGTPAPDFELLTKNANGLEKIKLSDHKGTRNVVLLFVPAAFTGVCTEQLCDASGGLSDFTDADAVVYAISPDTVFAQEVWAKQNNITIPLLSDYQKSAVKDYDIVLPDLAGHGPGSQRAAFVIDKQGIIQYSEQTPTPGDKPDSNAIMAALTSL